MELSKVEILVEKYHNGETSLEEEKILRDFFINTEEVPVHLLPEKEFFAMINLASEEEIPFDNFMEDLEAVIDNQTTISLKPANRNKIRWIAGIAASIALIVGSYMMFFNQTNYSEFEITDEQLAYEEAQKTLIYISQKLNKGTTHLSNIDKINKPIENLNELNKLDLGISKMQSLEYLNNDIIKK